MDIQNKCLNPVSVPKVTGCNLPLFRCGQCVNCLKQKANELAVRAFREFFGQRVSFITFTYDDEHCPIQKTKHIVNPVTGEFVLGNSVIVRDKSFFDNADYQILKNKKGASVRRYKPIWSKYEWDKNREFLEVELAFMSVYYYDIKCLFKRFRQKFPKVLNHFICVPEYGGIGFRPHYHLMAFGLLPEHEDFFKSNWKFGYVDVRNPNTSQVDDVRKLSMYVAKYCTKGKFDCPYVKEGICAKPRRSVSQNFGVGSDFDSLVASVTCRNELGVSDVWFNDDLPPVFNEYALNLLKSRREYNINGFHYPFPKYLLDKIFKKRVKFYEYYYEDVNDKGKSVFVHFKTPVLLDLPKVGVSYKTVSSPLQNEVARSLLVDLVSDALREQRKSFRIFSDCSDFAERCTFEEWRLSAAREALERQFISDLYSNSLF